MNQNDAFSRDPTKPVAPAFMKMSEVLERQQRRIRRGGMLPDPEILDTRPKRGKPRKGK